MKKVLYAILTVWIFQKVEGILDDSYELPKNVKPIRYTLTMEPEVEKLAHPEFKGSVLIELETLQKSNTITLNSRFLTINASSIKLTHANGTELQILKTSTDTIREFYQIHLAEDLIEGQSYNLSIPEFSGPLKYDNVGFYLAKYADKEGKKRRLVVTDFEASDARKAFPCFDEPQIKATFIINLIRTENYTSASNQELVSSECLGEGRYKDTFAETVLMSTYLVAFVIADYKYTSKNERHRIFARKDAVDEGQLTYALTEAVGILKVIEEYTGIDYVLKKMDMVAIPDLYYADEAMENWGLVTFSEKHLLITNASKTEDKQRCISYISHEFGHQWFGNLVTFRKWDYIWLSEGFGAYFQYKISSMVKPSWRLMEQFVMQIVNIMLLLDAKEDTEPMNYRPREIGKIPSPYICYFKASSVLHMMENFLTSVIFQKGLQIYLKENKFGSTEPKDLYAAFQKAVDQADAQKLLGEYSVLEIMQTWDSKAGFPLIKVARSSSNNSVEISQCKCIKQKCADSEDLWHVPINFAQEGDPNINFSDTTAAIWLTGRNQTVQMKTDGWFLINKKQTGFYRVFYDLPNWEKLGQFLNTKQYKIIPPIQRHQLLIDSFMFANLGLLPYAIPLDFTKHLAQETDYVTLSPFTENLGHLNAMLQWSPFYDVFQNYVKQLLTPAYEKLGCFEKDSDAHLDKFTRTVVVPWMCRFGSSECQEESNKKLQKWQKTNVFDVSPDLQRAILCCGLQNASKETWEFIYDKFVETRNIMYLDALGCSDNEDLLRLLVERIVRGRLFMTNNEYDPVMKIIAYQPKGVEVVFNFLKEHSDLSLFVQTALGAKLGRRCTTKEQLEELKALNSKRPGLYEIGINNTLHNLNWVKKGYLKEIENWLQTYKEEVLDKLNVV